MTRSKQEVQGAWRLASMTHGVSNVNFRLNILHIGKKTKTTATKNKQTKTTTTTTIKQIYPGLLLCESSRVT